jgi:hypothetical protein
MKKAAMDKDQVAEESDETYTVVMKGGSIGDNTSKGKEFGSNEEARSYAKRMNSRLSPGEKQYYKMKYVVEVNSGMNEDFDNGYDKQIEVDANGYFPDGAHNAVSKKAGPASANQGDNPLQKGMMESRSIHTSLVSGYRQFKK